MELRLHFGPGYRAYYAVDGAKLVLLLCAGDKKSQRRDIEMARSYWNDHVHRKRATHG